MRITFLITFTLLISLLSYGCKKAPVDRYISADGGLRMRKKPDTGAPKVVTVPNRSPVKMLEEQKNTITLSGKSGKWTRIKWKKHEGWVFGGFLSATRPPEPAPDYANPYSRNPYGR